jgi:hypothetical protein
MKSNSSIQTKISSFLNTNEKKCDICNRYEVMINKQNQNRYYNKDFKRNRIRKKILNKIIYRVSKICKFSKSTIAISISLFDQMISKYDLDQNLIGIIAVVVLGLVVKLNESLLISYHKIFLLTKFPKICSSLISNLEKKLLFMTDFNINLITPFHFVKFFSAILHLDDCQLSFEKSNKILPKNNFNLIFKIYKIMSLNYEVNKYSSTCIALVAIMIENKLLEKEELLPKKLQKLTGLTQEKIFVIFQKFYLMVSLRLRSRLKNDSNVF